ncbi:Fc.00g066500.m01.CDS01 [Cosmosporella sp. VM-42]
MADIVMGSMDSVRDDGSFAAGDDRGSGVGGADEGTTTTTSAGGSAPTSGGNAPPIGGSGGKKMIQFTTDLESRVFNASDQFKQVIAYRADNSVVFRDVRFVGRRTEDDEFEPFAIAKFNGDSADAEGVFIEVTEKETTLNLTAMSSDIGLNPWLNKELRLQVDWKTDESSGNSSSGFFYVIDVNTSPVPDQATVQKAIADDSDLDTGTETIGPLSDIASSTGDPTLATVSPSATSTDTSSVGKSSGGGGGLSKGATAGVAIGAVIGGLLLIGALAWFFLRRRRQNKDLKTYTEQPSNTYMVDKEIPRRNTDSPNSPYSDENGIQRERVPLEDITVARNTSTRQTDQARSFTPYDDAPPRTSTGSHAGRSNSGTHTPQGVSTNVAHLVEEGMTAEEIQRLEEEERQLDDEIERAGRR